MDIIKYKIIDIVNDAKPIFRLFSRNKYKTIQELTKNNKEYIESKNKLQEIIEWLLDLSKYDINELRKNISYNNEVIEHRYLQSVFLGRILVVYDRQIEKYNEYFKEDISKDLKGIYVGWLFYTLIVYYDIEELELYEYIYPEFFEKYKIKKLFNLFNIHIIINDNKKKNNYHDQ
jgi:hypothetical protein